MTRSKAAMPKSLTITGSRSTQHRKLSEYRDLFAAYIGPFAVPDSHFYLGGASGIDSLALLWLSDNTLARLTVVVPATLADQPADAGTLLRRFGTVGGLMIWSN